MMELGGSASSYAVVTAATLAPAPTFPPPLPNVPDAAPAVVSASPRARRSSTVSSRPPSRAHAKRRFSAAELPPNVRSILVIEDNEVQKKILLHFIGMISSKIKAHVAGDIAEAIRLINGHNKEEKDAEGNFDAAFCDIQLPQGAGFKKGDREKDGYDLGMELKKKGIPFFHMSADTEPEPSDAIGFAKKPVTQEFVDYAMGRFSHPERFVPLPAQLTKTVTLTEHKVLPTSPTAAALLASPTESGTSSSSPLSSPSIVITKKADDALPKEEKTQEITIQQKNSNQGCCCPCWYDIFTCCRP